MIDVYDIPSQKEIVDKSDYSAIGRAHGLAECATEIDTQVTGGQSAVEEPPGAELARDDRRSRTNERRSPHRRHIVRVPADLPRAGIFSRDSRFGRCVQGLRESAIHLERLRNRRRNLRQDDPGADRLCPARRVRELGVRDERAFNIDGDPTDRVPASPRGRNEMQRLIGHAAANRNNGI
jgi:hypothetical protein